MDNEAPVLGFDIGGTQIRAALASRGRVVATGAEGWPSGLSPAEEVDFIADLGLRLARECAAQGRVRAAGVALAAMTDGEGVVVEWPNRPSWRALCFKSLFEARLSLPVAVEDDANAAALAEWQFGAGRGYRHLLVLVVGTGVGSGLILDGKLFRGRGGWAGELGHVVMVADGVECPCGRRGCLQTVASGRALERAAAARGLRGAPSVTSAAAAGEAWAREAVAACGSWLGLAAANTVALLDLEAVVIGGGLSSLGGDWWDTLGRTFEANLLNRNYRRVGLHKAALPDGAGLLGAAGLAWQLLASAGGAGAEGRDD